MAQSPTISIPRKKTDDVDWTTPIRSVIAQSYGENPDNYNAECASLQRCRQDAVKGAGSDMTARDLLYKYFGQLELLELRFSEIKVTFPWYDAFTGKLTTQTSLAYEKASIIFQMAATHSAVASTQNRSDPEGLKRSFYYFRTAAGMLNYINDNFLHAPSTDLSRDVVKLLVGIMLAQATEVFFEKLIDEKKSAAPFIAKVAAQGAFLYNGLVEDVKEFYGKNIFDRNWVTLLQIKAKYFTALMHYHQYLADTAKGKYGEALARITLAESLAKEANKLASSFGSYFIPSITLEIPADGGTAIVTLTKTLMTLTGEKKIEACRENDLIYNAVPVAEATLPAVDKLVVANPVTIQEVYGSADVQRVISPDMFGKLIPLSVHKSASIYSEEKAKLARAEAEKVEEADSSLAAGLASLGLPTGLQKWKDLVSGDDRAGSGALPRELEQWAEEIDGTGGVQAVDDSLNKLGPPRAAVTEDLAAVGQDLENESKDCERMRIKYEHEWTQEPSAPLTKAFRQEIKWLNESLTAAAATDDQAVKMWNSARSDVALLLSGPDNLERFFAEQERAQGLAGKGSLLDIDDEVSSSDNVLAELSAQVTQIDEGLGKLNKIKRERGEVLKDLKDKIQTDDVSHLLLVNHRSANAEQTVFAAELEKFRPYQQRLVATVSHQEVTLEEIARIWKALKNGRGKTWVKKAEALEKRRVSLMGRFIQARETWVQVREGVVKGAEFYRQLGDLSKTLRKNVNAFVKPRNSEREQLTTQLETKKRLTSPSATETPPSRPPPPSVPPSKPSYDLARSMASMSLPPHPPSGWDGAASSSLPAKPPIPPVSSSFPSYIPPPPAPRQPSYSSATSHSSTPAATYSMPLPLPPPPPPIQRQEYSSSADPYGTLFSVPGLSSQFSLDPQPQPSPQQPQSQPTRQRSLPPPPPPPPSLSPSYYQQPPTAPFPSSPQQYTQYSTYPTPTAQGPYQWHHTQSPHQQPPYGALPASPPSGSVESPPPMQPPAGQYGQPQQQWPQYSYGQER